MALSIQFTEYAGRVKQKIISRLNFLIIKSELFYYKMLRPFLIVFVALFYFLLIPILIGTDYDSILKVAEFGVVGSGTLAILTLTYAIAKKNKSCDKIMHSGELLLKSTIALIIGFGLLPVMTYTIGNHKDISEALGIFSGVYDVLWVMGTLLLMLAGTISLGASSLFFIYGILELIDVFIEEKNK